MNFESVLIITYGRSGSTLLQGLLNSIDGCVVRGENYNMCYGLFLAWQSLRNAKREHGKGEEAMSATSPWFGAALLDEDRFFQDARTLIYHQLVPDDKSTKEHCVGFKEIRYLPADFSKIDLSDYLDFLAKLFPNPAMIVLTRDHDQVANSAWWKSKNPDLVKQKLSVFEKEVTAYAKGKGFVYFIDYKDMTGRTDTLKRMFDILGAPYEEEKVEQVLATRHSYTEKSKNILPQKYNFNKSRSYKVDYISCSELVHFSLDKLIEPTDTRQSIGLRGIAALRSTVQGEYRLVVRDSTGEHPVKWGLPSPRFAEKHADVPKAGFSRFQINGISLTKGEVAEMCLVGKQGECKCFARIHRNKRERMRSNSLP